MTIAGKEGCRDGRGIRSSYRWVAASFGYYGLRRPMAASGSIFWGNNGGSNVDGIDLIGLQYGISDRKILAGREIGTASCFIRQAAPIVCWRGLLCDGPTYVNVAGLWAASCSQRTSMSGLAVRRSC